MNLAPLSTPSELADPEVAPARAIANLPYSVKSVTSVQEGSRGVQPQRFRRSPRIDPLGLSIIKREVPESGTIGEVSSTSVIAHAKKLWLEGSRELSA